MQNFDVIVIGGGSAGLQLAMNAELNSQNSVLLLDSERTGGECTWSGCVPSKAFIHLSKINDRIDVFQKVQKVCETIYHHEDPPAIEAFGCKVIEGKGSVSFIDKNTVLYGGEEYTAETIVIATGSVARIPNIKGLKETGYLTNQNFFEQASLPQSIITIGGGVIALELSLALSKLGVKVTILEAMENILPSEDAFVREKFCEIFKENNVEIINNIEIQDVYKNAFQKKISFKNMNGDILEISAEEIFVCAGRAVELDKLKLENAGVNFSSQSILVNEFLQTNVKNIYAIGDCSSEFKFSHIAGPQGEMLAHNLLHPKEKKAFSLPSMTWAIFTTPEYSRCGLNEKEARAAGLDYKLYSTDYHHAERPIMSEDKHFFIKVLTHKGLIIGAYCMGERAGEIIAVMQIMLLEKIPFKNLSKYILAYPTYIEAVRTLAKKALRDE